MGFLINGLTLFLWYKLSLWTASFVPAVHQDFSIFMFGAVSVLLSVACHHIYDKLKERKKKVN